MTCFARMAFHVMTRFARMALHTMTCLAHVALHVMAGFAHVILHHFMVACFASMLHGPVHVMTGIMFHLSYCSADENHECTY
jgi:hypothetical protein